MENQGEIMAMDVESSVASTEAGRPVRARTWDGRATERAAWGVLLLCFLVAAGLRTVPAFSPFAITGETFAALRSADLQALRALGIGDSIDSAVEVAGRAELDERLALEARAREAGTAEYRRLVEVVETAGMQRFVALPHSEQSRIRDRSFVEFVLNEGARAGLVTLPAGTEATSFAAETPDVATATRLGKPSLAAPDAARLGNRTAADRALQDDLALLEIAVGAAEEGERIYANVRRSLFTAGNDAFRQLDASRQRQIRGASYADYVYREGFAVAPDDVKRALGGVEAVLEPTRADALRASLGLSTLSPADRVRLGGFDSAALGDENSAARRAFIQAQGAERLRRSLHDYFAGARCIERGRNRSGEGAGDIFLRGDAAERRLCVRDGHELMLTVDARWDRDTHRWVLRSIDNWGGLIGAAPAAATPSEPASEAAHDSDSEVIP